MKELERMICHKYNISKEELEKLKKINLDTAIKKYLSNEDFERVVKNRLYFPKTEDESETAYVMRITTNAFNSKDKLMKYFKTNEAKKWYFLHNPPDSLIMRHIKRVCQIPPKTGLKKI
ncbi:MAG: hypothetical protein NUV46_03050 [Nanoarchaeota archaeon]|nr:hypothetical protein [Nanoarchaeota archaeon]